MIFDDWKSWFHAIIGFVAGFSIWLSIPYSLLLSIIFICYQLLESDNISELFCDFAEFSIGFAVGVFASVVCWLNSNLNIRSNIYIPLT
jgi:hypothetical protein